MYIYSFGGITKGDIEISFMEKYNIRNDIWEILHVKLPFPIVCPGCIRIDETIYIFGGYNKLSGNSSCVTSLTNDNKIAHLKDLEEKSYFITEPIFYQNKIHLFSGGEEDVPPNYIIYNM